MKTHLLFALAAASTLAITANAQHPKPVPITKPPPPTAVPPVYHAPPAQRGSAQVYVYEQKLMGGRPPLISPEQAQEIVDHFKTAYPKLGSPHFLIYVNRELVEDHAGLKLASRTEKLETAETRSSASYDGGNKPAGTNAAPGKSSTATRKLVAESTYQPDEKKTPPTLADRQTVRDVERLAGRPLRAAGAKLADVHVATQMLGGKPPANLAGQGNEKARHDRHVLSMIADVAIEVLISSRNATVATVSGDKTINVPDIQATAIRLSDARILGQAATADLMGRERYYDVREVTEAVALALMDDMATEAK